MDELHYQIDLLTAMNQKLATKELMYRTICETSSAAFLFFDLKKNSIETIGCWSDFFDFSVKNRIDLDRIIELYEEGYELELQDLFFLEKQKKTHSVNDFKRKNSQIWTEIDCYVGYEGEQPIYKILRFKNVTKIKIQNEELKYMAYYDPMTGLYNRNYFFQLATGFLNKAKENNDRVSILFIDIDNFRQINDGLGILVGDELVQEFGQYLKSFEDSNTIISHFTSDIYCMAIYDPRGNRSVAAIHEQIKERCQKPFLLTDNVEITVSVSIGVAEYPEASNELLKLVNFAEIVMFKAKKNGKNRIQYFDDNILTDFLKNVDLENQLKSAIYRNSFEVLYQPQFDVKSRKLRGVEALVRMRDEEGKLVSPASFIPIAEKNGSIFTIGFWIMNESIHTFSMLHKKYQMDFILSLNISALQFEKPDFVSILMECLKKYEVSPELIELELTESVMIKDLNQMKDKMQMLREYGVKISLDDFGTGYSSLSYLKGLPIDTLKIDKSFVDTVPNDPISKTIMESIMNLTKQLDFVTIAEGVETEEQFVYLNSIQCDNIQGYLMGKPMTASDLENVIIHCI